MTELQQLAAAELVWVELALELAYHDVCAAFVRGETAEVPDPQEYGLSEALARQIAVEAYQAEVAAAAEAFDEAADTVRMPAFEPARAAG